MTKVISFVNSKGGAGKTTLAWALATLWNKNKKRILLIDTDPQGTLMQFHSVREDKGQMEAISVAPSNLERRVQREVKDGGFDYILIDTPGRLDEVKPALTSANLVVLPVQPGGADFFSFKRIFQHIEALRVRCVIVPNRIKTEGEIKSFEPTVMALSGGTAKIAPHMRDRVDHRQFTIQGLGLIDVGKPSDDGFAETVALGKFVEEQLCLSPSY